MSNRIILPNGQAINESRSAEFLRREIVKLKQLLISKNDDYQTKLLAQHTELEKLDKIMTAAFDRLDAYEKKLNELGVDCQALIEEYE